MFKVCHRYNNNGDDDGVELGCRMYNLFRTPSSEHIQIRVSILNDNEEVGLV